MFCSKCGSELNDGAAFCQKCGAAQTQDQLVLQTDGTTMTAVPTIQAVIKEADDRPWLMKQIENSFEAMAKIKKSEDKINGLKQDAENAIASSKNKFALVAIWFTSLVVLFLISATIYMFLHIDLAKLVFIGAFCPPIAYHIYRKDQAKKIQLLANKETDSLASLKQDESLSWLPYDYRDSTAFLCIFTYLKNDRAHNLKEAINLYETECHQARMEKMAELTVQYAYEAREYSRSAMIAADGAAGMAAADLFFSLF